MSERKEKPRTYLDPTKEAKAVAALRASVGALDGEDDQLLLDTIEGETSLLEAIDKVLGRMTDDRVMVEGLEAVIASLETRKARFDARIKTGRAQIEQALMIADLDAMERPTATLVLSRRAPSLLISEESEIPSEYWRAGEPTLDRKALTAALKSGATVAGASLSNSAPSLTVRTK